MELVINRCFGGFQLSIEAQKLYAKKSGFELFFYKQTKYIYKDDVNEDDIAYSIEEYDGNEHVAETHRTWY